MSLTEWMEGIKSAWNQARQDYQRTKRSSRNPNRRTRADAARKPGKIQDIPKAVDLPARLSLHRDSNTKGGTAAKDGTSTISSSTEVSMNTAASNYTILDESFLKEVQRSQVSFRDVPSRITSETPHGERIRPQYSDIQEPQDSQTVPVSLVCGTKRGRSTTASTLESNEEYILRVQRRVKHLEEELEAARARLSIYEQRERSESLLDRTHVEQRRTDLSGGARCTNEKDQGHELTKPLQDRQQVSRETKSASKTTTPGKVLGQDSTQAQIMPEDPFYLSPSKLLLSPVQVHVADLTNGEIARKEAVQALKRRIKRSDV